jgi:hypothetical protein
LALAAGTAEIEGSSPDKTDRKTQSRGRRKMSTGVFTCTCSINLLEARRCPANYPAIAYDVNNGKQYSRFWVCSDYFRQDNAKADARKLPPSAKVIIC